MAVKIRLRRMGRRNRPFFRVIAADGRTSTTGRFIENLGWYDPNREGINFDLKMDRIDYWIGEGAQMSDTVVNLTRKARQAPPVAVKEEVAEAAPEAPVEVVAEETPAPETEKPVS